MNINVKSTKVLKTGTSDYGEWKLVQVITDEDVKYTTLAKEADQISLGVTLNISNLDENDKGKSFKKFEYVEGTAKPAPTPSEQMTPAKWDDKDRITRASIEGQVALKCLTELTIAGIKLEDCPDILSSALRAKIEGFMGTTNPIPQAKEEEAVKTDAPVDLDWLKKSLNELQWADCGKYLKEKYKVEGTKISEQVKQLNPLQADEFTKEVKKRLEEIKSIDKMVKGERRISQKKRKTSYR